MSASRSIAFRAAPPPILLGRVVLITVLIGPWCGATAQSPSTRELAEMTLEQLANLEVTSVSKVAEPVADAPAAIFVITSDDIRRSGVRTLPEALRLAPNLQVARVSASAYTVRARGINNTSSNKLLVLIDGRSVYSPLFSGVFWDVQDVMVEDIDRIEVVSGPGGTLWGVNAVNGVINVITRSATRTRGGLVTAGGGNRESDAAVRYGGDLAGGGSYRVYGRYIDRDATMTADGARIDDAWHKSEAGFRADWERGNAQLMLSGSAYRGTVGQPRPGSISISGVNLALAPIPVSGVNLVSRWTRTLADGSELRVQAYYDRTERTVPPTFADKLDLFDLEFQHARRAEAYSLVWGGEYRYGTDRVSNSAFFAFLPAELDQRWGSLFAQVEATPRDDLRVIVGARVERNDYTGTEFLPNARIAWKAAPDQLFWSAISRTVRAPSRLDRDPFIPGTPPFLLRGGPDVPSEVAKVFEAGYRGTLSSSTTFSLTAFHARYERLHTQEIAPSRTFIVFAGGMSARATGVEAWGTWQVSKDWRLSAGYMGEHEKFRLEPGSNDAGAVATAGRDPANAWLVRASGNLAPNLELDVIVRGVAALSNPAVPRYSTIDMRLGWRPRSGLEIWVAGRNLDGGHGEFNAVETRTELGRSVFVGLRWDFGTR